jgi:hypothetical protein
MRKCHFPKLERKAKETVGPREPSPCQPQTTVIIQMLPPTPSTPGGDRRKPEVHRIENAKRQDTLLPPLEDKQDGEGTGKDQRENRSAHIALGTAHRDRERKAGGLRWRVEHEK